MSSAKPVETFLSRLRLAEYRPSGFDYMRLLLAASVVVWHSCVTSYGLAVQDEVWKSPLGGLVRFILPMFFALSGFLVAGSLQRCASLMTFMGLRGLRIYPALAVEVLLSALLVGPLVTTLDLPTYFSASEFWIYLVNVTGHVNFTLPGVFHDTPLPYTVNSQLWTVPWKLVCYVSLGTLHVCGLKLKRHLIFYGIALFAVLWVYIEWRTGGFGAQATLSLSGGGLVMYFLAGVGACLYAEHIVWSRKAAALAALATYIIYQWVPGAAFFGLMPCTYLTVCLGLFNPPRNGFSALADYSYGLFLYGFVIQQFVVHTLPFARLWYVNALISLPLALLFGAVSWHMVEKPALGLKGLLMRFDRTAEPAPVKLSAPRTHSQP